MDLGVVYSFSLNNTNQGLRSPFHSYVKAVRASQRDVTVSVPPPGFPCQTHSVLRGP